MTLLWIIPAREEAVFGANMFASATLIDPDVLGCPNTPPVVNRPELVALKVMSGRFQDRLEIPQRRPGKGGAIFEARWYVTASWSLWGALWEYSPV